MRSYIDAADLATQEDTTTLLATLALAVEPYTIQPDTTTLPKSDVVVICGPKSAPIGAQLLAEDPCLGMVRDDRWWIVNKATGERYGSPLTGNPTDGSDLGYLSRRHDGDRVVVHIAGIHSPGSRGVLHYLAHHLRELYRDTGDTSFSISCAANSTVSPSPTARPLTKPLAWTPYEGARRPARRWSTQRRPRVPHRPRRDPARRRLRVPPGRRRSRHLRRRPSARRSPTSSTTRPRR